MSELQKISKVLVVEGRDDTANLKRFFDCETYETGGSAINQTDLARLARLHETHGIVVFTDPDFQGERIRKIIMAAIPTCQHAFLRRSEAAPTGKGSLGIEHANSESLQTALAAFLSTDEMPVSKSDLTAHDLMTFGLTMGSDSRKRREFLGESLRIGYVNGKQLLKRLQLFSVSAKDVARVMQEYEKTRQL
ncbi:MAG: ribonuclease M5 [Streptococcaceae bacterium]|nr:ribonuclease M5 [Streptococcaceae bacterium]